MGDGLHHEADGRWIEKEYAKVFNSLYPEIAKERRKKKAVLVNDKMEDLLKDFKCKCGGKLKQGRSGSKVAYCEGCDMRYKLSKKKK